MERLSPARQKFVVMWGEMSARCATTRTAGRAHALLLTSNRPLNADEIREHLGVSRSNISAAMRELESWRLIRTVHQMGDRRDYFEPVRHVWEAFHNLLCEHERRLLSPFRVDLQRHLESAEHPTEGDAITAECLRNLVEFLEIVTEWVAEAQAAGPAGLRQLVVTRPGPSGGPRARRRTA
ncbi:MAG TPA: MarR family transcriptional regulator [Terriglobales bacterium]|nr:MarR family transcriptional regulator [Terriglobales bacterium]